HWGGYEHGSGFCRTVSNEQDPDESPPSRGLDREADFGAEPQVPAAPSLPEPEAPPYHAVPDWEETTQVVARFAVPPPPAVAGPGEERRQHGAPPQRATEGGGDHREAAPRHRDTASVDYTEDR